MKNFVELQKKMDCIYSIVDLHAITVFQDPKKLEKIFWRLFQVLSLDWILKKV